MKSRKARPNTQLWRSDPHLRWGEVRPRGLTAISRRSISPEAMISGIGVFYPDKKPTQRLGIVPDVEVRPTMAGIRAGRDEVLEEALRQIRTPDAGRSDREDGSTSTLNRETDSAA